MDDLVVWLRTQLDEDEARAMAAPRGPWSVQVSGSIVDADGGRVIPSVGGALDGRAVRWPEGPVVEHVVGHDPARVLREIDAKREVVRLAERAHDYAPTFTSGFAAALEGVLRMYAVAYADRPGFREEWRP
jgi:hypothetical protein